MFIALIRVLPPPALPGLVDNGDLSSSLNLTD
jgi:hypothetical protein